MNKKLLTAGLCVLFLSSCNEANDVVTDSLGALENSEDAFGVSNDVFSAEEWLPGGELGTTRQKAYSVATPNVLMDMAMNTSFDAGKHFFEKIYTIDQKPRMGLGPVWVRNSCIKCHPNYGHGQRQPEYRASTEGNGYLLVIFHPDMATTTDGVAYTTEKSGFVAEVTGMPQTQAMAPFKAPVDESQIKIDWKTVQGVMPSGISATQFPDGEKYELIYPDVTIPLTAFNTSPRPENYAVRLESTIGLYGTGLLDAIDEEDILAQWQSSSKYVAMNPGMWNKEGNTWAESAWYTLADGTKKVKRFTYAMTRASLQDGAGSNAIWNITNVSRSDRRYLYSTPAWAKAMSEDNEVIDYIAKHGNNPSYNLTPYYVTDSEGNPDKQAIAEKVYNLLSMNTAAKGGQNYLNAFGADEMSDKDYYDFMVWHRGLAVPAARDLNSSKVKRGKQMFKQIGCASCHRPSWKTGKDNYWVDNSIKSHCEKTGKDPQKCLPKFANQTIWPYTDMVQHRLYMINDIRTGWCRTTPLWGRGLSYMLTGREDRLHDCRARNEIEAIMWHGYSKDSQAYSATLKFYELPKEDRDAIVAFLRAI